MPLSLIYKPFLTFDNSKHVYFVYFYPCFVIYDIVFIGVPNDALYKELWHACAGPLVNLPREGERVYYFPQGHMEQVFWTFADVHVDFYDMQSNSFAMLVFNGL